MPIYTYRCPTCRAETTAMIRGNRLYEVCPAMCGYGGPLHRVFGFSTPQMLHEHYNTSVGKVISSHKQHRDELKRLSDERSERTGIEHRFVPNDGPESVGVTNKGIDESNVIRAQRGEPLLPKIPGVD